MTGKNCPSTKTSEIIELLKTNSYKDIPSKLENIDDPLNATGRIALMYATAYREEEAIRFLLENGANAFKENKYGDSAFSIAFEQEMEDIAREFIHDKFKNSKMSLTEDNNELSMILSDINKGKFAYFVASHICATDSKLRDFLGLDSEGARSIYASARIYYQMIGEDDTRLLGCYRI